MFIPELGQDRSPDMNLPLMQHSGPELNSAPHAARACTGQLN